MTPLPLVKGRALYAVCREDDGALRLMVRGDSLETAYAEAVAHPALQGEQLHVVLATADHAARWRNGESIYHDAAHATITSAHALTTQLNELLGSEFPEAHAAEGVMWSGRYYVHLTLNAEQARSLATWMETHR